MKEKTYNITICIMAVLSVILSAYDFTKGLSPQMMALDAVIYILFVFDYFVRLILSDKKIEFVKNNILDLIAILPFNSALRILRIAKFSRLSRLAKLSKVAKTAKLIRVGSVAARLLKKVKRFLNTNGFKYMLLLCALCVLFGAVGIMHFEGLSFGDALWWSFVTATTVGYGDLSPATTPGRIIASALMLVGIGLIGSLTSSITTFFMQKETEEESASSGKVEVALTVYHSLNEKEKEVFKNAIK